jgi:beta-glucosidase
MAAADAVVVMAGTNAEEGADRATFTDESGHGLAASAAAGTSLDWYVAKPNKIATTDAAGNTAHYSGTVDMLAAIMSAHSSTGRTMAQKTTLVLKDNAGVAMDARLLGANGPAILEVWFPGQEDGVIVGDLLTGRANPGGKLPVTMPVAGKGFLDAVSPDQYPGVPAEGGKTQAVTYSEKLGIGYRWYDSNGGGGCAARGGRNPCVAFPFGFGLSYTRFTTSGHSVIPAAKGGGYRVSVGVKNAGDRAGSEVVQAYVALPASADALGDKQPPKRLVGFERVDLAPGEARKVTIAIDPSASNHPLSVWSAAAKNWVIPRGRFTVLAGTSSAQGDLVTAGTFDR